MAGDTQLKIIQEVCERMESSQEGIEKTAYDAVNQHDKVSKLIEESMSQVMELLSTLEFIGMELETATLEAVDENNAQLDMINEIVYKQNAVVAEIGQIYQNMVEHQQVLADTIHNMESEIAAHRDSLELAKEIMLLQ